MKYCAKCKQEKDESEFSLNAYRYDNLNSFCKLCHKEYKAEHYQKNKKKYVELARIRKEKQNDKVRNYVLEYFSSHPCVDCGESDPIVLEFDHVRGRKRGNVMRGASSGWSLDSIKKEISKCEIRCANCHRKKNNKRFWKL